MALREDFLWGGATAANQCEVDIRREEEDFLT